ncbi:MAG: glycosyltransferase family 4 protein [Gemmatimonadetes bacterium]|nr:glycosyltransferase family 4 protein [Gemmatimonadota bacterium]
MSREKGPDIALEAYRLLHAMQLQRETRLIVAGDGPEADTLKDLAAQYGLADRVLFTGFVARPVEVLSSMDAIVFSSRQEGLPLALLEGMAAGALPIVTRVGGMPEVINDPELGWVVEAGDVAGLAQAMAEATALDRPTIAARRERVLERVRTGFDAQTTYRMLLDVAGLPSHAGSEPAVIAVARPAVVAERRRAAAGSGW